jgi:hypothetical protein
MDMSAHLVGNLEAQLAGMWSLMWFYENMMTQLFGDVVAQFLGTGMWWVVAQLRGMWWLNCLGRGGQYR